MTFFHAEAYIYIRAYTKPRRRKMWLKKIIDEVKREILLKIINQELEERENEGKL